MDTKSETTDEREKRRRLFAIFGAGFFALIAIFGAVLAINHSRPLSRTERLSAKDEGPRPGREGWQQASRQGEAGRGQRGEGRRGGPGGPGRGEQMAKELGLTPEQQKQIETATASLRPQMRTIMENHSLSKDQRRSQMQALRTQMQSRMRQYLTPEQQQRMARMQQQRQQRREALRDRREQTRQALIDSGQTPPERRGRGNGGNRGNGGRG
jgi:Spy/CpxP family protein refolding chaperone